MSPLAWLHLAGGMTALVAGAVAFGAKKGGRWHVAAGTGFCVAMFVLGATATLLAPLASPPQSPVGGAMACYFVATAWLAARRDGTAGIVEKVACALVLALAAALLVDGVQRLLAPPGQFAQPPAPGAVIALGLVCLLAGLGDVRLVLRGALTRTQRLVRHLWRMGFAFFIATGSFFLGQQDVLPQALRGSPLLPVLAFAPFALTLFWLVRVRRARSTPTAPSPALPVED